MDKSEEDLYRRYCQGVPEIYTRMNSLERDLKSLFARVELLERGATTPRGRHESPQEYHARVARLRDVLRELDGLAKDL